MSAEEWFGVAVGYACAASIVGIFVCAVYVLLQPDDRGDLADYSPPLKDGVTGTATLTRVDPPKPTWDY